MPDFWYNPNMSTMANSSFWQKSVFSFFFRKEDDIPLMPGYPDRRWGTTSVTPYAARAMRDVNFHFHHRHLHQDTPHDPSITPFPHQFNATRSTQSSWTDRIHKERSNAQASAPYAAYHVPRASHRTRDHEQRMRHPSPLTAEAASPGYWQQMYLLEKQARLRQRSSMIVN